MATTRPINSDNSFWVTTFSGKGDRSYTITGNRRGDRARATFTEAELFALLESRGTGIVTDDGIRPDFDRE